MIVTYVIYLFLLFLTCGTLFKLAFLSYKFDEMSAFINNIITTSTLLFAIIASMLRPIINPNVNPILIYPFDFFAISFMFPFFLVFHLLIYRERKRMKKGTNNLTELRVDAEGLRVLPLKYEIYRKLAHLIVICICFLYFIFGVFTKFLLDNFISILPDFIKNFFSGENLIFLNIADFTQYLAVFLTSISLMGLLTADYVRIIAPEDYPLKSINRLLRQRELKTRIGPHITMAVGTISIILIFGPLSNTGPLIVSLSIFISSVGDSSANLIGITLGRHKIRGGKKSYEGLIGGILFSFLSGILFLFLIFQFFPNLISPQKILFISLTVALIIGIIDYLDLPIDDNLSFLIISSIIIYLLL